MYIVQESNFFKKLTLCFIAIFAMTGGIYYYFSAYNADRCAPIIIPFDMKRDFNDVMKLFKDNWYWLIASSDYNVPFMLESRSPNHYEEQYYGKLITKVMRDKEGFKGFLAYYPKNFYIGQVLFVAIEEKFRGKGYAQQLVQCALHELKQMGILRARLVTRVENFAAQAVYKKAGFQESERDAHFIHFEKSLS